MPAPHRSLARGSSVVVLPRERTAAIILDRIARETWSISRDIDTLPIGVEFKVVCANLVGENQLVVSFLHDLHLVALESKFEQCNRIIAHELRRNWAAREIRELLKATRDVLAGLSHS
jgi:hypothetical protein